MQLIVFSAFAIVLGVPRAGPPWLPWLVAQCPWMGTGTWTASLVVGQVAVAGLVGWIWSSLVVRKLEREPAWLPAAQQRLSQGSAVSRIVLIGGFAASVLLSDWIPRANQWKLVHPAWGLADLIALLPFFTAVLVSWTALYPADRAIRQVSLEHRLLASVAARPVWSLRSYLNFMFRQHVLIIAAPMVPIVIANNFSYVYRRQINDLFRVAWADQVVLVLMAGLVFLFAPIMLRYIWQTRVLPPGELRNRLENLCRRVGLTYREILIWETDGMVVNAAVMGMFRPVRYVLLSDGLLEMLDDERIEAVFGHEAGHVKHRHIEFFLLFAVLSMLIVGGITLLVGDFIAAQWPRLIPAGKRDDYLQIGGIVLIIVIWAFGFGLVSRRFEWQADLFGARSVTPPSNACAGPCFVHGTAAVPAAITSTRLSPVCTTAAGLFADALQLIARLNGIPAEAPSWRHSSIANRIRLLRKYADDPTVSARLELTVLVIKTVLVFGTIVGLGVGAWLYS